MQNLNPTQFSAVADRPSAVSDVFTIAPAPLLPGEKQADYAEVALRVVRAAKPRDAIEEFLVRDVVDLTWEILRLRRVKVGTLRARRAARGHELQRPWRRQGRHRRRADASGKRFDPGGLTQRISV